MAKNKFAQMTTKKLNALMATASDDDKKAIEAVLAAREQAKAPAAEETAVTEAPAIEESQLSPEEEAAIKAAEENGGLNPLYNGSKATQEKKAKPTDEERHALAEELKANIYHRCQAVPFNTIDWVDGYIAGVIEEKRTNKVLYAIKTDDGHRIVKVHDSNLLRILDETVEPEKRVHTRKAKSAVEKPEWTPEAIAEAVNKVIGNVGKAIKFEKYHTTNAETDEEKIEYTEGRIVAIVPDKRAQRLLYRISVPAPIEGNPLAVKTMHKVTTLDSLQIAEDFDAEGEELNKKYRERREAAAARTSLTPQDRFAKCEEAVKKAEEKLKKVTEELEAKKKQLEDARKELDEWTANQANNTAPESIEAQTEETESLA